MAQASSFSFLPFRQPQQLLRGCFWSTGTWRSRRWRRRKRLSPQSYWVNFPTLLVLSLSSERINFLSLGVCSWGEGTLRNVPRPAKSGTGIFLQSESVFLFLKIQFYTRDHQQKEEKKKTPETRSRGICETCSSNLDTLGKESGKSARNAQNSSKLFCSFIEFTRNVIR